MILADTSLWVGHLRSSSRELTSALTSGEVLGHPHVTGELACGNLHDRAIILRLLRDLPQAVLATEEEALECIEMNRLHGRGRSTPRLRARPGAAAWRGRPATVRKDGTA